jgi:predicted PurR-regulated permease PerM
MLGIDSKSVRCAWSVLVVPALVCALYIVRRTLFVFVVALMLAYLLYPLVDAIDRRLSRRRPNSALALPFILILSMLGVFLVFVGRQVHREVDQFKSSSQSPAFIERVKEWRFLGIPIGEEVAENSKDLLVMVPQLELGRKLLTASRGFIDLLIVPILSFLMLKEGPGIRSHLLEVLDSHRTAVEAFLTDAHRLMLQYMRALLLLCLSTLICFSVVLTLLGVRYAFLLASLSFFLEFVPMVGPLAAAVVIVSVTHFSGYPHPLWLLIAFLGVYRIFLDYVAAPHLMRKGVELHPLLVLFGVFAGGEVGGIAGVFLSVPALSLLRLVYFESRKRRLVSKDPGLESLEAVSCAREATVPAENEWAPA